jgi:hypothetical protein
MGSSGQIRRLRSDSFSPTLPVTTSASGDSNKNPPQPIAGAQRCGRLRTVLHTLDLHASGKIVYSIKCRYSSMPLASPVQALSSKCAETANVAAYRKSSLLPHTNFQSLCSSSWLFSISPNSRLPRHTLSSSALPHSSPGTQEMGTCFRVTASACDVR